MKGLLIGSKLSSLLTDKLNLIFWNGLKIHFEIETLGHLFSEENW